MTCYGAEAKQPRSQGLSFLVSGKMRDSGNEVADKAILTERCALRIITIDGEDITKKKSLNHF